MTEEKQLLTVDYIDDIDRSFDETKEIEVLGATVYVNQKFRPSKITECITEFIERLTYARSQKYNIEEISGFYLTFLLIKHFTSLKLPHVFEQQIQVMRKMLDNKLIEPIVVEFDKDELEKVMEEMHVALSQVDENQAIWERLLDRSKIENPELLSI